MSQAEFGPALGASHRTAVRWDAGRSRPSDEGLRVLAERLVSVDAALAAEAAAHLGETLESLGLVETPRPPLPPPPALPPPPSRPQPLPVDLVDVVLCAAANHTSSVPESLRPLLYTAFRRAREVGLTVEEAEKALAPKEDAKPRAGEKAKSAGRPKRSG